MLFYYVDAKFNSNCYLRIKNITVTCAHTNLKSYQLKLVTTAKLNFLKTNKDHNNISLQF